MKANELMRMDWVQSELYGKQQLDFVARSEHEWYNYYNEGSFCDHTEASRPIPLTAEILENNFPDADKVAWWYADDYEDADDRITYEIHISGGALGINGFMWYVHELQHALRLCGLNDLADGLKL